MGGKSGKSMEPLNTYRAGADEDGKFGIYGGRFVAETLMPLILEVERAYEESRNDPAFAAEMSDYLAHYVGRPSPLYFARRLTHHLGGAKIYLKREDLNHTGAHKINSCIGQILLARRMGKTRIIAETGAGQHGVATATVCALFDLPCVVYMGVKDIERQAPNVYRMEMLGAEVRPVTAGSASLKDALNEALRDWVANVDDTYYIIGTVAGPHPYPTMVRDFQTVIGDEVRAQIMAAEGRLPDTLVACIGGGSNAMGLFHPFLDDAGVRIIAVEAAGEGLETGKHGRQPDCGLAGRAPRQPHLPAPGRRRPDHRGPFHLGGPGLPGHRSRTRLVARRGKGGIRIGHRQASGGSLPHDHPHGRDHSGPGGGPRGGPREQDRAYPGSRQPDGGLLKRPRRQGPGHHRRPRRGQGMTAPTRITKRFAELAAEDRGGLIAFVTAGDPDLDRSLGILRGLPAAGADLIELGMPFSDPMADGPSIQASSKRALTAGATMARTLAMVETFRRRDADTPVILMGYYNPVYVYGVEEFLSDAKAAGVDGLIMVDLPPEEEDEMCLPALDAGLDFIYLTAPTTDDARLPRVLENAGGFVYYVSITGVTGTRSAAAADVQANLERLRRHTGLPIAVGFGIKTPEQAAEIVRLADAAVVGAALVDRVAEDPARPDLAGHVLDLVSDLAAGVRGARGPRERPE